MDLSREIFTAETWFRAKLEEFFLSVFPVTKLESHGLDHHRRVWAYTKGLLLYPGTENYILKELLPQKLIIAAYLHDIGMVSDSGPKHGIHSRNLCERFLEYNDLNLSAHTDLLEAIEYHDDKEYRLSQSGYPLLQILSVADDLDALGYTGIYRYTEIYLMRNVGYEVLGDRILKNVTTRYGNLEKLYGDQPGFVARHQPRFEAIKGFCNSYSEQAAGYQFGNGSPAGWCGIAELIGASLDNGSTLSELVLQGTSIEYDKTIKRYFTTLMGELTSFNNEQ
jgi:hypothetical protein